MLKCALQFGRLQGLGKTGGYGIPLGRGKVVQAASLLRDHAAAEAGEFEDVVTHAAQHIFRLQRASTGKAGADVQGVKPGHADQSVGIRWRREPKRHRIAEDKAEVGSDGGKVIGAPESNIHLQGVF